MLDDLLDHRRLIVEAELAPVVGSTLQPTGFPNLGAAEFTRPGEPPSLLVESVQSMTNHLEGTLFDEGGRRPVDAVAPLPWIAVRAPDGSHLTSSREEPHRLSGAYVREATIDGQNGSAWLIERLGLVDKRPLDHRAIAARIFALDPLCLVHGVFFSEKGFHGNPKVRRAIHAVVEAHDVAPVISGGLKRDDVAFTADKDAGRAADRGYGFIPFSRTEYTARRVVLSSAIDVGQIVAYGLAPAPTRVLALLALLELATLLDAPLRLRTACALSVEGIAIRGGGELPSVAEIGGALVDAIADLGPIADGTAPTIAVWDR